MVLDVVVDEGEDEIVAVIITLADQMKTRLNQRKLSFSYTLIMKSHLNIPVNAVKLKGLTKHQSETK